MFPPPANYSSVGNYAGNYRLVWPSIIRMPSNSTLYCDLHPVQPTKYFTFYNISTFSAHSDGKTIKSYLEI